MKRRTHVCLFCFVLTSAAAASAAPMYHLTTLATFNGANGGNPIAGLIADASGNLYGTTSGGGANNAGTVFQLAAGTHALTTLATFNGANGSDPAADLLMDASGNLYGTTFTGGANNQGAVFEVAALTHVLSTLATFNGTNGFNPVGGLLADTDGNLYGTTNLGGANSSGIAFKLAAETHAAQHLVHFHWLERAQPLRQTDSRHRRQPLRHDAVRRGE